MAYLCLTDFNKLPNIKIGGLDKSVHFILHFFFTLFWYLYLSSIKSSKKNLILYVFIGSVLYGSLIEIAQGLFTTTRKADVLDVFANSIGSILASFAIHLKFYFFKRVD